MLLNNKVHNNILWFWSIADSASELKLQSVKYSVINLLISLFLTLYLRSFKSLCGQNLYKLCRLNQEVLLNMLNIDFFPVVCSHHCHH